MSSDLKYYTKWTENNSNKSSPTAGDRCAAAPRSAPGCSCRWMPLQGHRARASSGGGKTGPPGRRARFARACPSAWRRSSRARLAPSPYAQAAARDACPRACLSPGVTCPRLPVHQRPRPADRTTHQQQPCASRSRPAVALLFCPLPSSAPRRRPSAQDRQTHPAWTIPR